MQEPDGPFVRVQLPPEMHENIRGLLATRAGDLWVAAGRGKEFSICRLGDSTARQRPGGLDAQHVLDFMEDTEGGLWISTDRGVRRSLGGDWILPPGNDAAWAAALDTSGASLYRDRSGRMWFTAQPGIACWKDGAWRSYAAVGRCCIEDGDGILWAGTSRYTGDRWTETGVPGTVVAAGEHGVLIADDFRLAYHLPDVTPPRTVILAAPTGVTLDSDPLFTVAATNFQATYQYKVEKEEWSEWNGNTSFRIPRQPDGATEVLVRSRDVFGNTDPLPVRVQFEVDTRAPVPEISSPGTGDTLAGVIYVRGQVQEPRFAAYEVIAIDVAGDTLFQRRFDQQPPRDTLAVWASDEEQGGRLITPDGLYTLEVILIDTLGVKGSVRIHVLLDNESPSAAQTSPVALEATSGGVVYAQDGHASLWLAPNALRTSSVVSVTAADSVRGVLGSRALRAYRLDWDGGRLQKPGQLLIELPDSAIDVDTLGVYRLDGAGNMMLAGGTSDQPGDLISVAVMDSGTYFVAGPTGNEATVVERFGPIRAVPRVLRLGRPVGNQPGGVTVTFGMEQAGDVDVRVYNRAGRLVRMLRQSARFERGTQSVVWDGRDDVGQATDGLFLIVVRSETGTQTVPVAVTK